MGNRVPFITVAIVLITFPAAAADLSVAASKNWTGPYLGVNIGVGWSDDRGRSTCVDPAGVVNGPACQNVPGGGIDARGVIAGAQVGYNWQSGDVVLGLEADWQAADISGHTVIAGQFPFFGGGLAPFTQFSASERIAWLGTARARLGAAFGGLLLYATGGLAYGHAELATNLTIPGFSAFPASAGVTRAGWTAGGGIEFTFSTDWSGKVEALYYDLGDAHISAFGTPDSVPGDRLFQRGKTFELQGGIVRIGLNCRF